MPRHRAARDYRSGLGAFVAGQEVDLPEDFAAHINRDSPGVLEPVAPGEAEERQLTQPPTDRMVKSARRRDRQGDPGDQGAITKGDHQAMRDKAE